MCNVLFSQGCGSCVSKWIWLQPLLYGCWPFPSNGTTPYVHYYFSQLDSTQKSAQFKNQMFGEEYLAICLTISSKIVLFLKIITTYTCIRTIKGCQKEKINVSMYMCYTHICTLISSVQSLSYVWLCNPMDCSTPGFPDHHQLPELTQTHTHLVGDTIQSSHPLSSPSPPTFSLSQHQGLFAWVSSSHQVAKVLVFQLQHQSFQWIFRTDFL